MAVGSIRRIYFHREACEGRLMGGVMLDLVKKVEGALEGRW